MNLDQRNDDQPIRSRSCRLWKIRRTPANLRGRRVERPFSKWILPISLFIATIFTTLWAGAYQVYNGPIMDR